MNLDRIGYLDAEQITGVVASTNTFQPMGNYAAATFDVPAGVPISGHTAVYVGSDGNAYPSLPDSSSRFCIGVSTNGAATGATVKIQTRGVLSEPSWSWSPSEPVWLGPSGGLTQTRPTTGALFQVGVPAGPTSLCIEMQIIALLP